MKITDSISIGLKNFKKRKSNIINIIITSISLLVILIVITVMNGVNYYITDQELFLSKIFRVGYNNEILSESQVYDYLNEMKHIKKVFSSDYFQTDVSSEDIYSKEVFTTLYGIDEDFNVKIKQGRSIEKGETNVIILPEKLSYGDDSDFFSTEYIDTSKFIGKEITIKYIEYSYDDFNPFKRPEIKNTYTKIVKVIGTYDLKTATCGSIGYANLDDIKEINDNKNEDYLISPMIYIDDVKNIDDVKAQFNKINDEFGDSIDISRMYDVDYSIINGFSKLMLIIFSSIIGVFILNLTIFIFKLIKKRKKEIGLYKAIGYNKKDILKIYSVEQMIVVFISFIIANILYLVTLLVYNSIIVNKYPAVLILIIKYPLFYSILLLFLFIILTVMIFSLFTHKISKVSPGILVKE